MYREGNTIYSVMHHGWRKGVEQFRNRIAIHVVFDPAVEHEEREHVLSSIAAAPTLLRQRNELLEALDKIKGRVVYDSHILDVINEAKQAIKNEDQ